MPLAELYCECDHWSLAALRTIAENAKQVGCRVVFVTRTVVCNNVPLVIPTVPAKLLARVSAESNVTLIARLSLSGVPDAETIRVALNAPTAASYAVTALHVDANCAAAVWDLSALPLHVVNVSNAARDVAFAPSRLPKHVRMEFTAGPLIDVAPRLFSKAVEHWQRAAARLAAFPIVASCGVHVPAVLPGSTASAETVNVQWRSPRDTIALVGAITSRGDQVRLASAAFVQEALKRIGINLPNEIGATAVLTKLPRPEEIDGDSLLAQKRHRTEASAVATRQAVEVEDLLWDESV
jgi:hypothetical protein